MVSRHRIRMFSIEKNWCWKTKYNWWNSAMYIWRATQKEVTAGPSFTPRCAKGVWIALESWFLDMLDNSDPFRREKNPEIIWAILTYFLVANVSCLPEFPVAREIPECYWETIWEITFVWRLGIGNACAVQGGTTGHRNAAKVRFFSLRFCSSGHEKSTHQFTPFLQSHRLENI